MVETDRPEDYAVQELLDLLGEVKGLSDDDRKALLEVANMVVSEHDRWLHLACRRTRERNKARDGLLSVLALKNETPGTVGFHTTGAVLDWQQEILQGQSVLEWCPDFEEALADEPEDSKLSCNALMQNGMIMLDSAGFETVERLLSEEPKPNEAIQKLFETNPPWSETKLIKGDTGVLHTQDPERSGGDGPVNDEEKAR